LPALEGLIFISPVFNSAQSSPVIQVLRWRLFPGYPFGHGAPPRLPASRGESKERPKVSLGGIAVPFSLGSSFAPTSRGVGLMSLA